MSITYIYIVVVFSGIPYIETVSNKTNRAGKTRGTSKRRIENDREHNDNKKKTKPQKKIPGQ